MLSLNPLGWIHNEMHCIYYLSIVHTILSIFYIIYVADYYNHDWNVNILREMQVAKFKSGLVTFATFCEVLHIIILMWQFSNICQYYYVHIWLRQCVRLEIVTWVVSCKTLIFRKSLYWSFLVVLKSVYFMAKKLYNGEGVV